ncbi:MAG: ABC transporter permease subunit [Patescibacteria group bacterium]
MLVELRRTLLRSRAAVLGWGLALALYGIFLLSFYDKALAQKAEFQRSIEAMPREMLAFFGNETSIFEPAGYLTVYFFSMMPVIVGIFAVLAGSGLLVHDEERGVMDLVLAHPISRKGLFAGRLLGFAGLQAAVLAVAWLGFVLVIPRGFDVSALDLALPFLSLYAVLMFFGTLAVLLSMVLPSRGLTGSCAGFILMASYFLSSLVNLDSGLAGTDKFSPLHYYQGGAAVNGMNWTWFACLLGAGALFSILAWCLFERRDIRVAGESGWRWRQPRRARGQEAAA